MMEDAISEMDIFSRTRDVFHHFKLPYDSQLLFFKKRFLPKDHPDRSKMDRFSAKLRKLGLREETIAYGPSKEKWEVWNRERS